MHQFLIVDKNNKRRRLHGYLCNVVHAQHLSLVGGRLMHNGSLGEHIVQHAGLNPPALVLNHPVNAGKKVLDPQSRFRRRQFLR